jgi:hypothetical protein
MSYPNLVAAQDTPRATVSAAVFPLKDNAVNRKEALGMSFSIEPGAARVVSLLLFLVEEASKLHVVVP